jgi:hypothetical protein
MSARIRSMVVGVVLVGMWAGGTRGAQAQTLIESSMEARFQLDLHVSDAALARLLPTGWSANVAAQGPAKDANLRAIFIERLTINDANGRPVGDGSSILVYLTVPATDPSGANVQLVIGGITDEAADAPGPFGVYQPGTVHTMRRTTSSGAGPTIETQDWSFAAATGEHLELHLTFEKGIGNHGQARDTPFASAKTGYREISRQQQVLDILRNVTTSPPDRVRDFSFSAGGGSYASLFDGTQRPLSWDNIVWLDRDVLVP